MTPRGRQHQDIDAIVERVTAVVRERLAGSAPAPAAPAGSTEVCPPVVCERCPSFTGCSTTTTTLRSSGADRIGGKLGMGELPADLARTIDHTLLKPEATKDEVVQLCKEACEHGFKSVCINPTWVRLCRSLLEGSDVLTVAVVGFPLGAGTPAGKAFEAREAVRAGAQELDMVINIGALRSGDFALVHDDIRRVVQAARPVPVKVILETSKLTDEEKVTGSALSKLAGAAFVKTSTGFGGGGATVEDVALMRRVVGANLGVKASGGVRTKDDAEAMIAAGATRLGASAGITIVTGKTAKRGGY
jgi:deoxyribose-phosphate aldolase